MNKFGNRGIPDGEPPVISPAPQPPPPDVDSESEVEMIETAPVLNNGKGTLKSTGKTTPDISIKGSEMVATEEDSVDREFVV